MVTKLQSSALSYEPVTPVDRRGHDIVCLRIVRDVKTSETNTHILFKKSERLLIYFKSRNRYN